MVHVHVSTQRVLTEYVDVCILQVGGIHVHVNLSEPHLHRDLQHLRCLCMYIYMYIVYMFV